MNKKTKYLIIKFFLTFIFIDVQIFSQEVLIDNTTAQTTKTFITIKKQTSPEIPDLNSKDIVYKQYSEDLQQYYIDNAANKSTIINFYTYKVKKDDTLFSIAARLNIPYDTIASINDIATADSDIQNKTLLLPTCSGLFVLDNGIYKKERPKNSIETLIQKNNFDKLKTFANFCYNIEERYFIYICDERFDQTSRAFFLDTKMKTPLDNYWLSSDYGYRQSPFGGKKQFHKGIDMAAPEGTSVYSCKAGKVSSIVKLDPTFGNYIVIKHSNGLSSIYAHLSKINVSLGDFVSAGQEIAKVGQTGQATGPHLHFEIRQHGQPTNPNTFIKR